MASSREAYTAPTAQSAPGVASNATRPAQEIILYICGDCGSSFPLLNGDQMRCFECGCRVLYKPRTKKMVQFEAR